MTHEADIKSRGRRKKNIFCFGAMFRFIVFVALWICTIGHSPKDYLEDYCGKTLYYRRPWIRLKLTRGDYPSNFKCNTSVVFSDTESGKSARLMVVVHKLETKCPGDRLTLLDRNTSLPLKGAMPYLCGKHKPKDAMFTVSSSLIVNFQSDASKNDDGFELYITRFHLGICEPTEFRCARGPCIDKSLQCDDHDQCGDDSDECKWGFGLVAALIGATCLGSLFTILVFCCCCTKYRSRCSKSNSRVRIIPLFRRSEINRYPKQDEPKKTLPEVQLSVPNLEQTHPFYSLPPPAYTDIPNVTSGNESSGPLPSKTPLNT